MPWMMSEEDHRGLASTRPMEFVKEFEGEAEQ
jgi:hypothetical protein